MIINIDETICADPNETNVNQRRLQISFVISWLCGRFEGEAHRNFCFYSKERFTTFYKN